MRQLYLHINNTLVDEAFLREPFIIGLIELFL